MKLTKTFEKKSNDSFTNTKKKLGEFGDDLLCKLKQKI